MMPQVSISELAKFVALRRKLLEAELTTALLVGRNNDAGTIRAEMRCLEAFPAEALSERVSIGRTVARSGRTFENEMASAQRRLSELEAEVRTWRANQHRERARAVTAAMAN